MISLENVKRIDPKKFDEVWCIVRSPKQLKPALMATITVKHVPVLSPSWNLFQMYRDLYSKGIWNKDMFYEKYVPVFLDQMKNDPKALALLNELTRRSADENIAIACFCDNESLCHRSIVGGILGNMGAHIECSRDYIDKYHL